MYWGCPKLVDPQNHGFQYESGIILDDFGVPLFYIHCRVLAVLGQPQICKIAASSRFSGG